MIIVKSYCSDCNKEIKNTEDTRVDDTNIISNKII